MTLDAFYRQVLGVKEKMHKKGSKGASASKAFVLAEKTAKKRI